MKTIIIEDEENIKIALENKLAQYCKTVDVIAWADTVEKGISLINNLHPDLILLDIKLPDGTGFDILQKVEKVDFKIIFTTAYNDYAIEAFKFSALDYLMKPVRANELIEAINKAEKAIKYNSIEKQLETLYKNLESITSNEKKIVLNTVESIHIIETKNIIHCEADVNYTTFYLADNCKIMVSKTMKEYEDMLCNSGFFRPHKSHLVNMSHIKSYEKTDGGYLLLSNNTQIPVSQRKRNELLQVLQKFYV